MRLILTVLFLGLSGCGLIPEGEKLDVGGRSAELTPYYQNFRQQAFAHGITSDQIDRIELGYDFDTEVFKDTPNTIGLCRTNGGQSRVYINHRYWDVFSEIDRQTLMYHELSHCLTGRDHLNTTMRIAYTPGGPDAMRTVPFSLMNAYHVGMYYWQTGEFAQMVSSYYLGELFDLNNKPRLFGSSGSSMSKIIEFKTDEDGCDGHELHPDPEPTPAEETK